MIIIRFPDQAVKKRSFGYLIGRFSFKSWSTGELMVSEAALPFLTEEGIPYAPALKKVIRFPDEATECMALGFLAKRFPLTTWDTGETMVPETAIPALTEADIPFMIVKFG